MSAKPPVSAGDPPGQPAPMNVGVAAHGASRAGPRSAPHAAAHAAARAPRAGLTAAASPGSLPIASEIDGAPPHDIVLPLYNEEQDLA